MPKAINPVSEIRLDPQYPVKVDNLLLQDPGVGLRAVTLEFRFGSGGGCNLLVNGDRVAKAGGYGSKFIEWIVQAEGGTATDPAFRKWLEHQVIYYGEKDRPYATFLLTLLK